MRFCSFLLPARSTTLSRRCGTFVIDGSSLSERSSPANQTAALSLSLSLSLSLFHSPPFSVASRFFLLLPTPPPLTIVRLRIRPLPIWLSNQELLVTLAIVLPDEHGSFVSTTACNVKRGERKGEGEDDEGSEDAYIRGITGAHRVIHCMETCNFVGLDIVSATTVSTMFFPPIRNSAAMKILNALPATPR